MRDLIRNVAKQSRGRHAVRARDRRLGLSARRARLGIRLLRGSQRGEVCLDSLLSSYLTFSEGVYLLSYLLVEAFTLSLEVLGFNRLISFSINNFTSKLINIVGALHLQCGGHNSLGGGSGESD